MQTTVYVDANLCTFAHYGTYGHSCNAPATLVRLNPRSVHTKNGRYWARRCATCATIAGGENRGLEPPVPFNPALHINVWK